MGNVINFISGYGIADESPTILRESKNRIVSCSLLRSQFAKHDKFKHGLCERSKSMFSTLSSPTNNIF